MFLCQNLTWTLNKAIFSLFIPEKYIYISQCRDLIHLREGCCQNSLAGSLQCPVFSGWTSERENCELHAYNTSDLTNFTKGPGLVFVCLIFFCLLIEGAIFSISETVSVFLILIFTIFILHTLLLTHSTCLKLE